MSWHDCQVHGIRVAEGQYGSGELELDLDYILEWIDRDGTFVFRVIPAVLRFHEVTNLRITLDWATPTAGLGPFSLDHIERSSEQRPNYKTDVWRLVVNWPSGNIEFEATGFTQQAWGREVVSGSQALHPSQRIDA